MSNEIKEYCSLCEEVEVFGEEDICRECQIRFDDITKEDADKLSEKNKETIDEVEARIDEAISQLAIIKKAITEENRTPVIGQGFVNMFRTSIACTQNQLAEASNGLNQIEVE
jgi:hypothetical protein